MSAIFVALAVIAFDQLSKIIILKNFLPGESLAVIKDIFHISLVFNKGIAFGIFSKAESPVFIWITLAAAILILFFLLFRHKHSMNKRKNTQLYLALVLGGAVGNLIDRIRFGYIIDFLDFRIWPVFNLADSAITIGTILLVLQMLKHKTSHIKH